VFEPFQETLLSLGRRMNGTIFVSGHGRLKSLIRAG
jgi:hypothetical protein